MIIILVFANRHTFFMIKSLIDNTPYYTSTFCSRIEAHGVIRTVISTKQFT